MSNKDNTDRSINVFLWDVVFNTKSDSYTRWIWQVSPVLMLVCVMTVRLKNNTKQIMKRLWIKLLIRHFYTFPRLVYRQVDRKRQQSRKELKHHTYVTYTYVPWIKKKSACVCVMMQAYCVCNETYCRSLTGKAVHSWRRSWFHCCFYGRRLQFGYCWFQPKEWKNRFIMWPDALALLL